MDKKSRIEWIDVAKGYGIILVIMGHCFNKDTPLHNWIFSFHMPLFFILSGYCFHYEKYKNVVDVLKDKFRALIIPYVKFCVLGILISLLVPEWRDKMSMKQLLVDIYCAYPTLTNITSIWYLIALFNLSVILYVVVYVAKKYNRNWLPYVFVGLSGCAGYLITIIRQRFFVSSTASAVSKSFSLPGGRMPLTLDTCMTALVFLAFGYWLKTYYNKNYISNNKKIVYTIVCTGLNLYVSLFLNTRVNLHGCTYGNIVWFYTAAILGTFAVILGSQLVCGYSVLKKILIFYGRNSLFTLGIQSLLIHILVYLFSRKDGIVYALYENVPERYGWFMFILITFVIVPCLCALKNRIRRE